MLRVVSLSVPIVDTYIIFGLCFSLLWALLEMLEDDNLNVLASTGFENGADRELVIWPVLGRKAVEHRAGIAVLLLESFLDHPD